MINEVLTSILSNLDKFIFDMHKDRKNNEVSLLCINKGTREKVELAYSSKDREIALKLESFKTGEKTQVLFESNLFVRNIEVEDSIQKFGNIVKHIDAQNEEHDNKLLKEFIARNEDPLPEEPVEPEVKITEDSV